MKTSFAMLNFNEAVEAADRVLNYTQDKASPEMLWYALLAAGKSCEAWNLWRAASKLGYFTGWHEGAEPTGISI